MGWGEKGRGRVGVRWTWGRWLGFLIQPLSGFWMGMPRGDCNFFLPAGSVFQLTHDVYKPFVFAAETLTDLSM